MLARLPQFLERGKAVEELPHLGRRGGVTKNENLEPCKERTQNEKGQRNLTGHIIKLKNTKTEPPWAL